MSQHFRTCWNLTWRNRAWQSRARISRWRLWSAGARDVKNYGRTFAARRRTGTVLGDQSQAEQQGVGDGQYFAVRPMLGGHGLNALGDRLFWGKVRGPFVLALHAPQVVRIAAAGLAPASVLVALDCILYLKQLGIVGMNGHSLSNPSQGREQIAGGLQLACLRNPVLHRAGFFLANDEAEDRFGRWMRGVQGERLVGQRLRFQPIAFDQGLRVLDEGIGENGAGKGIVFIELVGLAQQLNRFGGLLLREQFLAFGDLAVRVGLELVAIVGVIFQL